MPVFSAKFCQTLLEELEHFEQSDMPKGRPNTMNNHGVGEALLVHPGRESSPGGRAARAGGSSAVLQAGCLPRSEPEDHHSPSATSLAKMWERRLKLPGLLPRS